MDQPHLMTGLAPPQPTSSRTSPAAVERRRPARSAAGAQILLAAVVQILALSTWYSTSAVAPQLARHWNIGAVGVSWLTSSVLLGFAAGALVLGLLRVADHVAPHLLIPTGAVVACAATALPALAPADYASTIALRVLTGVALASVYPPGMSVVTSWTTKRRGLAVSIVVAALTLGSAAPHALRGLPLPGWRGVLLTSAAAALLAAVLACATRIGPHARPAPRFEPGAAWHLLRDRRQRLVTLAYLGHMWEVYGLWTWLAALLVTLPGAGTSTVVFDAAWGPFLLTGGAGALGCLVGGTLADRWGRAKVTAAIVTTSAICCLLTPVLPLLPAGVATVILLVWGFCVIGDSPMYSALLADGAEPGTTASSLTVQMALGYTLSVIPVVLLPLLAAAVGWPWALLALAPGPITSAAAMTALRRAQVRPLTGP